LLVISRPFSERLLALAGMHYQYLQHPDWWLRCSKGPDSDSGADSDADGRKCARIGAPFYTSGDSHFNPPEEGMLVFDDSKPEVYSGEHICHPNPSIRPVFGCIYG